MRPQIPFFLLLLTSLLPLLPAALPVLPENPDPLPLQPLSSPPSTIPAFPEQSDVTSSSSSCPLSLPEPLPLSLSCSPARRLSRCCPPLAAFLYSAYAAAALSLPSAAGELPVLPDDSESCAGQVEKALKSRGVDLPRVNATCDVAYCYCGVRLRRLTCAGAFVASEAEGRWAPTDEDGRELERECRRPGTAGCNRCLRALNQLQLKSRASNATNSGTKKTKPNDRECHLMGLTWLLSKNHTLYLPTATSILHAFMAFSGDASADGKVVPTSCTIPHDEMPFAVDSTDIDDSSSADRSPTTTASTLSLALFFLALNF